MRVGSLCTGYGGLDLAIGGELVFVSEIDRHACAVIDTRFPGVPNVGDFTKLDTLPECDVLTAGFPCQPVSQAGQRKGTEDERWLWDDIERLLGNMERPPGIVFLENVRGLLSANGGDAMARVVQGLAGLGYVGSYRLVRASDVGAPHRRERVFVRTQLADTDHGHACVNTDLKHKRRQGTEPEPGRDDRREHASSGELLRLLDQGFGVPMRRGLFGPYWPAVHRWERITGRPAPAPTDASSARRREVARSIRRDATEPARRTSEHDHEPVGVGAEPDGPRPARLNPRFVEWMMGLSDGWVTDCDIPRTAQLKILGNGVVPQQARLAWGVLT